MTEAQFLAPAEFPYGGLRGTMTHTLEAEWSWRIRYETGGMAEELPPTEFPTLASLETRWREDEKAMRAYLSHLRDKDLGNGITYSIGDGITRTRVLWHCLFDLVNHGTQHRREAAALLTCYGQSPGDLDFTVFLNQYFP